METIVATVPNVSDPDNDEFPVLSVGTEVDSGYILQIVIYHINIKGVSKSYSCEETSPHNKGCKQFRIGLCWFVENEGKWFYAEEGIEPSKLLYPIVYGEKALESYRSGEMFKRLKQLFGGPD